MHRGLRDIEWIVGGGELCQGDTQKKIKVNMDREIAPIGFAFL